MTVPGGFPINFRGDGPWRGMTTQSRALPQHFELLENCYVSSDGSEIRPIPGFRTWLDLSAPHVAATGEGGYSGSRIDARRKVYAAGAGLSAGYNFNTAQAEQMTVYSDMTHVHGFEFVNGRCVLFGESNYRIEPIFDSGGTVFVTVTAYTFVSATVTRLTLSANARFSSAPATMLNGFSDAGGAFPRLQDAQVKRGQHRLWITGLGGTAIGIAALNNKALEVVVPPATAFQAANQVDVYANIVAAGNNAAGLTGNAIGWITRNYGTNANRSPTVGGIASAGVNAFFDTVNSPSDDIESLAIWTVPPSDPLSVPITIAYQADVANKQRDFGDEVTLVAEGGQLGGSRRRQRSLPYRLVPSAGGDRLLLAAPGYNCCFQAPVIIPLNYEGSVAADGLQWIANDIYDKPRCVGVPKAVMWADYTKVFVSGTGTPGNTYENGVGATTAFGGAGFPERGGRYKLAVAYRDDATGETGLLSEIITVDTSNAGNNHGIRLMVLYPGYVMHESLALSINVYRSQKNGEQLFFDRSFPYDAFFDSRFNAVGIGFPSAKYGILPSPVADEYRHYAELRLPYTSDENLKKHVGASNVIEQMPMGAKAIRTMRGGWTVYGGALGNAGKTLELFSGNIGIYHDVVGAAFAPSSGDPLYGDPDFVFSRIAENTSATIGYNFSYSNWGCGARGIPPAYEGQELFSRFMFPYPRETVRIDKLINNTTDYDQAAAAFPADSAIMQSQARELRYRVSDSPIVNEIQIARDPTSGTTYLKLPRAQIQISEADHPGVTPSNNTTIISHESGEDVEGIGEANGQLVVCTRSKTYVVDYALSPVGTPASLANDRLGCIGANTMATFDLGCAWLSDRGPAAVSGGSVQWIGENVQHFFTGIGARYLRDSTGMMRHAWTAHDPSRALLYFGLYSDRSATSVNFRGNAISWSLPSTFFQDQAHSRFPCDEVLVYSYKVGAWSVWRPPTALSIKWMRYGIDQQTGQPAMFFLGSDDRIYKMDDDYAQWNAAPMVATVQATVTGTVIATSGVAFGQTVTNRGTAGTYWNAGMEVLVVSQNAGAQLIKRTTLVSIDGSNNVTLADSVTVASGDKLHIGVRSYTVTTNYLSPKMTEIARTGRIGVRYSLDGTTGRSAYVQATATTTQVRDSEPTGVSEIMSRQDTGYDSYLYLGQSDQTSRVMDKGLTRGSSQGDNMRLSIVATGGATIRLQDLYAESQ